MAGDTVEGGNINFTNWKDTQKIQMEWVKTIGDRMFRDAETRLKNAEADGKLEEVARIRTIRQQLQLAMSQLNQATHDLNERIEMMFGHQEKLRAIRNGQSAEPVAITNMWASFRVIERYIPFSALKEIIETPFDSAWRAGENYVDVGHPKKKCEDVDKTYTNLRGLLVWLEENKTYVPRKETTASLSVCWAFNLISDTAIVKKKELEEQLQKAKDEVYRIWEPGRFAGLPSNPKNDEPKSPPKG